jgi:hypothetical protein
LAKQKINKESGKAETDAHAADCCGGFLIGKKEF